MTMSRIFVVVLTLIILSNCVSAVATVQDLTNQIEQVNANVKELKASVDDFKSGLIDQINLQGIKNVVAFILAFITLNCFAYLYHVITNYINREKIKHERDKFVDNLKKENMLLKQKIELIELEVKTIRENFYLFNEILNKPLQTAEKTSQTKIIYIGIFMLLCGSIASYYKYNEQGVFLLGGGATIIGIAVASYFNNKKTGVKPPNTPENLTVLVEESSEPEKEDAGSTNNK